MLTRTRLLRASVSVADFEQNLRRQLSKEHQDETAHSREAAQHFRQVAAGLKEEVDLNARSAEQRIRQLEQLLSIRESEAAAYQQRIHSSQELVGTLQDTIGERAAELESEQATRQQAEDRLASTIEKMVQLVDQARADGRQAASRVETATSQVSRLGQVVDELVGRLAAVEASAVQTPAPEEEVMVTAANEVEEEREAAAVPTAVELDSQAVPPAGTRGSARGNAVVATATPASDGPQPVKALSIQLGDTARVPYPPNAKPKKISEVDRSMRTSRGDDAALLAAAGLVISPTASDAHSRRGSNRGSSRVFSPPAAVGGATAVELESSDAAAAEAAVVAEVCENEAAAAAAAAAAEVAAAAALIPGDADAVVGTASRVRAATHKVDDFITQVEHLRTMAGSPTPSPTPSAEGSRPGTALSADSKSRGDDAALLAAAGIARPPPRQLDPVELARERVLAATSRFNAFIEQVRQLDTVLK